MGTSESLADSNTNSKSLGQYMTPKFVAEFMSSLISKPKSAQILEPCVGEGVFLQVLHEKGFKNVTAYEIDKKLGKESPFKITYQDFLKIPPKPVFDVIIGNPPYVRWKNIPKRWQTLFKRDKYWGKIMNGLSDLTYAFIYHSINLLREYGELIFICPLFWTETVHGKRIREHLSKNGSFELLINLNEAKVFNGGSSTIIIFKYVKRLKLPSIKILEYRSKSAVTRKATEKILSIVKKLEHQQGNPDFYLEDGVYRAYLNKQFTGNQPWHPIPPTEQIVKEIDAIKPEEVTLLGNIAEIGNGMVSGLDKAFRLEKTNLDALNENEQKSIIYVYKARTIERFFPSTDPIPYIFTNHISSEEELKQLYPHFYQKLSDYKVRLVQRYDYAKDIPWWHWVFLRNKNLFERYNTKILVPSKERYDTRGYCRFTLIQDKVDRIFYATQDVTTICVKKGALTDKIEYVLGILNSKPIQKWITIKGFNRGGVYDFSEGPLKVIPIPRINWGVPKQAEFYRLIVQIVKEIINKKQSNKPNELDKYVASLLKLKRKVRSLNPEFFVD